MSELPNGWAQITISELVQFNPKTDADDHTTCGFVPMQSLGTSFHAGLISEARPWGEVKKAYTHFKDGDVLIAKVTPCFENGKSGIAYNLPNGLGAGSSEFCVFRPAEAITPKYLLGWFSTDSFRRRAAVAMTGSVGLKRVPKDFFLSEEIPLAPLNEQRRIADKLDTTLARVDACRARLDRVAVLLKRFRQSVLAAAVSGKLTEEWREENQRDDESAVDVVHRDAIAKQELLKKYPHLSKKKSTSESAIDSDYVFSIPERWVFSTWGIVSEWITYGFTRPMPHSNEGIRLLTAKDIRNFEVDIENSGHTTISAFEGLSDKDKPQYGDLLLTKDGTIGRVALVRTKSRFCINQSVAVCWLRSTNMNKDYLEIVANAEFTQAFIRDKAKGMAIQHLSITDFAQCPLPIPSIHEQNEIARRVKSLFAFADRLEASLATGRTKTDHLTPALLAKAFRGELVPQDPTDEPADVLLERIRAARVVGESGKGKKATAGAGTKTGTGKRGRPAKDPSGGVGTLGL